MSGRSTVFAFIGKDQFSAVADKVSGKAGGMGGKLGKAGLAIAGGMAAAGAATVVAGKALVDMTMSAAEDEKGQQRLALGLKNTTGATKTQVAAVEDWISKQGEALGVADDKLRPAFQRLAQSTGDVGDAQKLTALAMDVSAGTGKDLETVATALARAQDGNVGSLARLGIQTKDASGKTKDFKQIVKDLSGTFEGQASTAAGTLDGKVGRLRLMFDEAKESIGAKLLPVAEKLGSWIMDKGIPAFREWGDRIMPKVRDVIDRVKQAIEDNRPGLENLWEGFKKVAGFIAGKVIPVLVDLYGTYLKHLFRVLGKIGEYLPTLAGLFLKMARYAVEGFDSLYDTATTVLTGILTVAEKTMGWIPGIGDKIKGAKRAFTSWRDDTNAKIDAVKGGLESAARAVDGWNAKAAAARRAKVEANIEDLETKLAKAKTKLADPAITATRRAKVEANISQLEGKMADARRELNNLDDRTINVGVNLRFSKSGENFIRLPNGKVVPLASGGIVTRPTLALVGEAGPEAVIPLSKRGGSPVGGELHVHIHNPVIGSKEDLARYVTEAQLEYKRRRGVALGLA